jgi:hypothetical protein
MAPYTCPDGHTSQADDYCDVCGAPIVGGTGVAGAANAPPPTAPVGASSSTAPPAATKPCPNCSFPAAVDALFCEDCGYDFTTGQLPAAAAVTPLTPPSSLVIDPSEGLVATLPPPAMAGSTPAPAAPAAAEWVAEIWVDPDWYEVQEAEPADPCPPSGMPEVVLLHGPAALIGRVSKSRNIHPEIDCAADTSVSRRQAELTLSNDRWFIEDLQSTNGTYAAPASGPLPKDPLTPGQKRELGDNDRVYVGAWTRIVVRPATAQEKGS